MEVPAWSLFKCARRAYLFCDLRPIPLTSPISKEMENFTLDLSLICIISCKFDAIQFDITKNLIT